MTRALLISLVFLAAAGCMPENSLWGSASELFPLTVSRVEVRRNVEAFQVSYYNNRNADIDLVARVTVALEGIDLQDGQTIPLEGTTESGVERVSVVHLAGGEPTRVLPPIKRGQLNLKSGAAGDVPARGDFSILFEDDGSYGSGRNLDGTFSAAVQDAGFGDFDGGVYPDAGL